MQRPLSTMMAVALFGALFVSGCTTQTVDSPNVITADQIQTRGVTGALGEPIGKIIVVHARLKDLVEYEPYDHIFAQVRAVGDRVLPAPVEIWITPQQDTDEIKLPELGEDVQLIGYETCAYAGIPTEICRKLESVIQHTSYYLESRFVLLRVRPDWPPCTLPSTPPAHDNPIPISDISKHGIMGHLGKPLGTAMRISGSIKYQSYDSAYDDWRIWFLVDHIDDQPLATPIGICVYGPWSTPDQNKPDLAMEPSGKRMVFWGYEDGGFVGTPPTALNYINVPHKGEQRFETWFGDWSNR